MILRIRFLDRKDQLYMKVDMTTVSKFKDDLSVLYTRKGDTIKDQGFRYVDQAGVFYSRIFSIAASNIKDVVIVDGEYRMWLYEAPKPDNEPNEFERAKCAIKEWYERLFIR